MQISVLIATRNRPAALRRCLRSIARQSHHDVEVVIFDDASCPPVEADDLHREARGVPLRVVRSEAHVGLIEGRNRLFRTSRGEVLVVLDDDVVLPNHDALTRTVASFQRHEEAGLLAFRLTESVPTGKRLLLPFHRRSLAQYPNLSNTPARVGYFLGAAHALRRTVFERCGPFRAVSHYGHEELDLAYRAIEAGFSIRYVPSITAHHRPGRTPGTVPAWKWYYLTRNRILVAYAYLPWPYFISHVLVWLGWYTTAATRAGAPRSVLQGIRDAIKRLPKTQRRPLSDRALTYLKRHHGRLWW